MKWIKKFIDFFRIRCPECNAMFKRSYFDMELDKNVYECVYCAKKWI